MDDIQILAESVIQLEEIKEEIDDHEEESTRNSLELSHPDTFGSSVKEDKEADEEGREAKQAVFREPAEIIKESKDEGKDTLALCSEGISDACVRIEGGVSFTDDARTISETEAEECSLMNEDGLVEEMAEAGDQQQREVVQTARAVSPPGTTKNITRIPLTNPRKRKPNTSVKASEAFAEEAKARKLAVEQESHHLIQLREEVQELKKKEYDLRMQILSTKLETQKKKFAYYKMLKEKENNS